jgi:hypothetical protein
MNNLAFARRTPMTFFCYNAPAQKVICSTETQHETGGSKIIFFPHGPIKCFTNINIDI